MGFLGRLVIVLTLLTMCATIIMVAGAMSVGTLWSGPSSFGMMTRTDFYPVSTFRWDGMDVATVPHMVFLALGLMFFVFLLCALVVWRLTSHHAGRRHGRQEAEETKLMQELYHGFSRLEDRVESLETILLERERSRVKGLG